MNKCQHKDCNKEANYQGYLEGTTYNYCDEHIDLNGFCMLCGEFWGGVESFDFSKIKGYCENCVDTIKTECGELDDYEEEMYNS